MDYRNSYLFTASVSVYEWNMVNTYSHAEMGALIAPRPFMVESGYRDGGVTVNELAALEFTAVAVRDISNMPTRDESSNRHKGS